MQFAIPPRRSAVLPGPRSSRLPLYRRKQWKTVGLFAFAILSILYLLLHLYSSSSISLATPAGTAGVVIVTLLDRNHMSESYVDKIVANREDYANRHGELSTSQLGSRIRMKLMACAYRIHELLRKCLRLHRIDRQLSEQLGFGPSCPPCHGCTPSLSILLPYEPTCADHEPDAIA